MTNRRSLLAFLILVVLLTGANLLLRYGAKEVRASCRQVLVEDPDGVCRMTLLCKGRAPVSLERKDGKWRLVEPYAGSVDEQVVMKSMDILSMTPITDVVGDSALLKLGRTRADFSLDEPVVGVVLRFGTGEEERIDFGSKTPLADGVYASIGGLDSVFIVPSLVLETVDVDAERFRRRAVFAIDANAVSSFGIKRRTDPLLEFTRSDSGWRVRDGQASSQKVAALLTKVTAAMAERFVWPVGASNETEHASAALLVGYGLDPDAAVTMTVKGVDGVERRITFGKEAQDGKVYALVHGGTAIVTIPADLKVLVDQDAGSFTDSRIFHTDPRLVSTFSISDHDVLYAFVREKDGSWALESPIIARADSAVVDSILSRILSLSVSDGTTPEDGVSISLTTNAAKTVVSRSSVFGSLKPEGLRAKEIVRIDPGLVKRIVRNAGGGGKPVSVVYDQERKAWNLESGGSNAVPDAKGIESVLSAINPLSAARVERLRVSAADLDDYGLDRPFLTVAIDQEGRESVRRNIIIGKKTAGGRFATIGSSDAVFVIGEAELAALSANIVGK